MKLTDLFCHIAQIHSQRCLFAAAAAKSSLMAKISCLKFLQSGIVADDFCGISCNNTVIFKGFCHNTAGPYRTVIAYSNISDNRSICANKNMISYCGFSLIGISKSSPLAQLHMSAYFLSGYYNP